MLLLCRHGRTQANAEGRLLGRADPPLDEVGEAQAAALAAALPSVTRVVSSPLVRARATAAGFGLPVEVDERWIELDYGALDGVPLRDVPAATWARWRGDPTFVPAGGESLVDLGRRVRSACDDLAEAAAGTDVAVVSHVSPVKAAVAWALGVGDELAWRLRLDAGTVTRVAVRPTGPVVVTFNERPPGSPEG